MYMKAPFFHEARDMSHFPPSVVDLDYSCTAPSSDDYGCFESGLGPEDQVYTNLVMMYNQMVAGAKKMELFMGCPYKAGEGGSCNGPGTLELAPHNTVHKWVDFPWLNNRPRPSVPLEVARVIRVAREANLETLRKKTDLKLGISELLEDLEADGDDSIWVTLVPRSKGCINATVDGLRIEYIR
ncbi:hypothetical protein OIU77_020989 [Salix suchowensis]|uniref:Polyphenol oxidase C-terminal domain-containing protein n=1 Tax=Salix suchowensis TaxID=1278906 RepID=A0ABQ9CBI7_9ROSI|nr:hypothetical protein OIU77_020989 [Salix suchowensis]